MLILSDFYQQNLLLIQLAQLAQVPLSVIQCQQLTQVDRIDVKILKDNLVFRQVWIDMYLYNVKV